MKKIKRLAIILAIVFAMSSLYSMTLLAADATKGTITIEAATSTPNGTVYNIYKVLDLVSFTGATTSEEADDRYVYDIAAGWETFFEVDGAGNAYIQEQVDSVTGQTYIKWVGGTSDTDKQAFAAAVLKFAESNNLSATKTETLNKETGKVTFTGLDLGYYVVDSSAGVLCIIGTTNYTYTVKEKNETSIEKKVQETDDGENWYDDVIVAIGDTVNFKTTVKIYVGAENYVVHDKMTEGLTLGDTIALTNNNVALVEETDYSVVKNNDDGCTFHINFTKEYLNSVSTALGNEAGKYQEVVISYNAVLNSNAVIHGGLVGNNNQTQLTYGDNGQSDWDIVTVDTFQFDLIKYDGTNDANTFLDGAQFKLYDQKVEGTEIKLVKESDGLYRVALKDETVADYFTTTGGKVTIKGLDAEKTYWVEETVAPDNFTRLANRIQVAFSQTSDSYANIVYTKMADTNNTTYNATDGGIGVENLSGKLLPSTGGTGTKLFITFGSVMALVAFVVLVARRRTDAYMS